MNEKRLQQQLRSLDRLLDSYQLQESLIRFLTNFFKENRQMGSNDRRAATGLVYNYFRIGRAAKDVARPERLAMAELICRTGSEWLTVLKPEWCEISHSPLREKINFLEATTSFRLQDVFPFGNHLSASIAHEAFLDSFFTQPELFIRIHSGNEHYVHKLLKAAGIDYKEVSEQTLVLPNGTSLEQVKGLAGKYEVQDLSSQKTGNYFHALPGESWWDACAASGGKSILLKDKQPAVSLLVSDIRNSILRNLDERFERAGIRQYRRKIIDLTKDPSVILQQEKFDGIILDAPCSGSGTWSRTPEMIAMFRNTQIALYTHLQKQLALNALKHLKPGKPLIYITCSVFAEENEHIINFLEKEAGVKTEELTYLTGYQQRADTLFVARLIKS